MCSEKRELKDDDYTLRGGSQTIWEFTSLNYRALPHIRLGGDMIVM